MPKGKDGGMQEDGRISKEAKVNELCQTEVALGKFGEKLCPK
jgi:hypothetical protein